MRTGSVALAVAVTAVSVAVVQASELYAVSKFAGPGLVYRLDPVTGASSLVGPTGYDYAGDLASDTRPGSYRIWAPDVTTNTLLIIDPITGSATAVAPFSSSDKIVSLAFDPVAGKLYGTSARGFGAAGDQLYEIDPDTGGAALVGALGVNNVYALAFNAGTLFGVSEDRRALYQINTTTGFATLCASIALEHVYDIATRPEDNVTFAVDSGTNTLYTLDLSSGVAVSVGSYAVSNLVGLAFTSAPEPATVALLVLGGLGVLGRFRRR
ncbi:MAG: PEP-CTERM sorting domain-containing protein [Phycisphaerae bacterium]|nr:PEP-CTERM sorting domain-containing protein [Phycisphaerae bacterium]